MPECGGWRCGAGAGHSAGHCTVFSDWELINDYFMFYGRRRPLVNEVSLSCFTLGGKIGKVLMNWIKISFVVHCMSPQFFLTQVSILT